MDMLKENMRSVSDFSKEVIRLGEKLIMAKPIVSSKKIEFNSQICTTREQSEKLLALGLKKETADMIHSFKQTAQIGDWFILPIYHGDNRYCKEVIPAWSLHRLVELMPQSIEYEGNTLYLTIYAGDVFYTNWKEHTPLARTLDLYEHLIWYIEWLIKEGHFNKEYLSNEN